MKRERRIKKMKSKRRMREEEYGSWIERVHLENEN